MAQQALDLLGTVYPEARSLEAILGHVQRTAGRALEPDAIMTLMSTLFAVYARGLVHLHKATPGVVSAIDLRPVTTALARVQAQRGSRVTTMLLDNIEIDDADCRAVLPHLDGRHDRGALASFLSDDGGNATARLETALTKLARAGLLTNATSS